MKLKITTLVIVEEGQVQDIYHSLNDNQDKAYQEIINQVNAEYGDGGVLQWNEHFPTPGKPNPNYYTDSGATFNKHLRTQNKLKQKRK